ncbi:MAG: hypothetical protein OFPI_22490 [Osedax symbiont Rs2]|nr:MAG: hypothetical protein OFPI_22490 [Osedax symbiont Rs2]
MNLQSIKDHGFLLFTIESILVYSQPRYIYNTASGYIRLFDRSKIGLGSAFAQSQFSVFGQYFVISGG